MAVTTVLYDDDCGFCRWSLAWILRAARPGTLRPVAIQSEEGQSLLADVPPDERLTQAWAVDADGRVFGGGDAAPLLAAAIPGVALTAPLLRRLGFCTDCAYRLVAGNRSRLGRAGLRRTTPLT